MANLNKPSGLSPVSYINGSSWNGQSRMYYIPSSDTNAYYLGDLVKTEYGASDGPVMNQVSRGIARLTKSAAGNVSRGVVIGLGMDVVNLNNTHLPATKDKGFLIEVVDDPMVIFEIQGDNAAALATTVVGKFANFTVAAPVGPGASATVLATATIDTDAALPLRIVGLANGDFGPYARFLVVINLHEFASGATVSVAGTVTSVDASVSNNDILTVTGGPITTSGTLAIDVTDPGSDSVVGWDDSAAKLIYFSFDSSFTITNTTISVSPTTGPSRTNAIRNGAFNFWQRGTSLSGLGSVEIYLADAWQSAGPGGQVYSVDRSTDVPTLGGAGRLFNYSAKITCTTADASMGANEWTFLRNVIEGFDWIALAQRACTISFWVKSSVTGTYCVGFDNSGLDRALVLEYTINSANTWEYKTLSISASPAAGSWNYTTGAGLYVYFALSAGANAQTSPAGTWNTIATSARFATSNQVNFVGTLNAEFYLTGVQIQQGTIATEFEYRLYYDEYVQMQRYYEKSFPLDTTPAQAAGTGGASVGVQVVAAAAAQAAAIPVRYSTRKRTNPALVLFNTQSANAQAYDRTVGADCSATSAAAGSETAFYVSSTMAAGSSPGDVVEVHWTADAEYT